MTIENFTSGQPRVLVIENDKRWQKHHMINLARWGYCAFLAEGLGEALLKDAVYKAKQYRCHAALVDMRLLDHYDSTDSSGLDLVPKLKPTRSIIVTAYSRDDLMQKGHQKGGADDFISKRTGPSSLKRALDSSLQKICSAKKRIQIKWQHELSASAIMSSLLTKELSREVPVDQVDDLLGLLFPTANTLNIRKSDHENDSHVVMLNVYVDESSQPMGVQICRIQDAKDEIQIGNMVRLWDFAAQIFS